MDISDEYVTALLTRVMEKIISKKMTVSTAESCTGGLLAGKIIDYPGASAAYVSGFVTYTNESKHKYLGVSNDVLDKYGAVSSITAELMCLGAAKANGTDIGLSTTGVAGPGGGTAEKPVGLVYIGVCIGSDVTTKELRLSGSRNHIRKQTVTAVLELLEEKLKTA